MCFPEQKELTQNIDMGIYIYIQISYVQKGNRTAGTPRNIAEEGCMVGDLNKGRGKVNIQHATLGSSSSSSRAP